MSKAWIRGKLSEFARDVLRDFCLASCEIERLFQRHDQEGRISFASLRDLLGEEMNKGLLWRLKDTSHHLFRTSPNDVVLGKLLDWGVGYIFHESMKLKEDAYQQENYGPWFRELENAQVSEAERSLSQNLRQVLDQTLESVAREKRRIQFIIEHCLIMFTLFYARYRGNKLLARFLFDQNDLVRQVFKDRYQGLIGSIYGDEPELMYALAAQSLRQGGWVEDADAALVEALRLNPDHPLVQEERTLLHSNRHLSRRRQVGVTNLEA